MKTLWLIPALCLSAWLSLPVFAAETPLPSAPNAPLVDAAINASAATRDPDVAYDVLPASVQSQNGLFMQQVFAVVVFAMLALVLWWVFTRSSDTTTPDATTTERGKTSGKTLGANPSVRIN